MYGRSSSCLEREKLVQKFAVPLAVLLEAAEYANDTTSDRWDFAVAIVDLRTLGLNDTDLRFLVKKRWVEHALEVTAQGANGREFQTAGDLTFDRGTCFILTDTGIAQAQEFGRSGLPIITPRLLPDSRLPPRYELPFWNAQTRELWVGSKIAKRFKWHAENQEIILNTFQEEGWPPHIDDPLPPHPDQDSKRRLSDTIKCLNRKHFHQLIRFRGDGTGEGVIWDWTASTQTIGGDGHLQNQGACAVPLDECVSDRRPAVSLEALRGHLHRSPQPFR
jgi:hypothetical protein